ncbi:MAG: uL15m family ribosomal protein [Candidatus Diapherotrites archaeon]
MKRKRKKKEKLRGNRTHGKGNTKNKRGGGSRGGCGRAGSKKHKFMLFRDEEKEKKLKPKEKVSAISIQHLEELINKLKETGKLESKDGYVVIDGKKLGFGKILSNGIVKSKMMIFNMAVSEKAREKILSAGGIIQDKQTVSTENKKEAQK